MERHMEKGKFQFCYKNSIELLRMRNSNVLEVVGTACGWQRSWALWRMHCTMLWFRFTSRSGYE